MSAEQMGARNARPDARELEEYFGGNGHDDRETANVNGGSAETAVTVDDFVSYLPDHQYLFIPTRELWPRSSVNARVVLKDSTLKPSEWLDQHRPVEQMTWAPGHPLIITDKLMDQGGWIDRPGTNIFNLYRPPRESSGDQELAGPWLQHVREVFGVSSGWIIGWLAHRIQRPGEKINHALVLGGAQGIGKDTLLEPVKHGVGPWNWQEISPTHLLGNFNGFVKSVVLRISEARDLGDIDRYSFYDHSKVYTAAPPDVLRCNEKHLREHAVMNVTAVCITTNHKLDGIYLPADDRRHYVAWSERTKEDFPPNYWRGLYGWYRDGGIGHVIAYLRTLDITNFDPKAPPVKTPAFWEIVDANRSTEDAEIGDALDAINDSRKQRGHPVPVPAVTLEDVITYATTDTFREWLRERKNRRQIPHRMEVAGYIPVRNDDATDGLWRMNSRRQVIYALKTLSLNDRLAAATRLCNPNRQ